MWVAAFGVTTIGCLGCSLRTLLAETAVITLIRLMILCRFSHGYYVHNILRQKKTALLGGL